MRNARCNRALGNTGCGVAATGGRAGNRAFAGFAPPADRLPTGAPGALARPFPPPRRARSPGPPPDRAAPGKEMARCGGIAQSSARRGVDLAAITA